MLLKAKKSKLMYQAKKLALILANSMLVINGGEEIVKMSYIYYLV